MKLKILCIFAIFAMWGCTEGNIEQGAIKQERTIHFRAQSQDVRTAYDASLTNKVKWVTGDVISIIEDITTNNNANPSGTSTIETVGADGKADVIYTTSIAEGEHTFAGIYPSSAFKGITTNTTKAKIELPAEQTSTTQTFDPAADILVAKNVRVNVTEEKTINIPIMFERPMAIFNFNLKLDVASDANLATAENEKIENVKITAVPAMAANKINLTGRFYTDMSTGKIVNTDMTAANPNNIFYYGGSSTVTIISKDPSTTILSQTTPVSLWAIFAPITLVQNDILKFEISTTNYIITKDIKIGEGGLKFIACKRNLATINLKNATIKSNKTLVVDQTTVAVASTGGEKTINITVTPATLAWTATLESGATVTPTFTPTNGTGNGTITATFPENNDVTAKTAKIKISAVGVPDVNVVFTQDAAGSIPEHNYIFGEHNDFKTTWTSSYTARTLTYPEITATFASANKQSTTITDCPVTKGAGDGLTIKPTDNTNEIKEISITLKQWGTKAKTVNLLYSTDGTTFAAMDPPVSSSNFAIPTTTLPTGTKAVRFTFTEAVNQVGIESCRLKFNK